MKEKSNKKNKKRAIARAVQLPSGNWNVKIFAGFDHNGKRIRKSITAPTRWEAEKLAEEYVENEKEDKSKFTVGQALDEYIDLKRNVLSPATIHGYEIIRRNRLQSLMRLDIHDVNSINMQRAINEDSINSSNKSLSSAKSLVLTALKFHGVKPDIDVTLPPKKHIIRTLPSPAQVVSAIKGSDIELPCMLAIWLSLRMSEVRGLQFSDIQGNTIFVHSSKVCLSGKDYIRDVNKTYKSTRMLEAPQYIMDLIKKVPHKSSSDYIVDMDYQNLRRSFKRLMGSHGLNLRFHDLRHLNASVMLKLGVPDKYAMERGGWSTNSTLKTVYQHTFSDERKNVDNIIDNYFNGLLST